MGTKEETEKATRTLFYKIADKIPIGFLELIPQYIKASIENVEDSLMKIDLPGWDTWCDDLVKQGFCDQDTADLMKTLPKHPKPGGWIYMIMTIARVFMTDISAILDIYALDSQYNAISKTTPHPAPIDNLVRSMIIDPKRANENRAKLKQHGFDDTQIDNIVLSYYRTTDEGTIRTAFLRGIIDEEKMYERMRELGYTDTRIKEILPTWKLLPGPQDLFQMVAKEAFEPDIYEKLGLAEEFPSEQVQWLEDQGISKEWAMKYWIAHWDQPSIGQGFEMLHRGVIDFPTLDMLFRAVEIPSFWRDKLTKIAYIPFTRVDVRRMHDLGTISDEQLITSYMDLGFAPEKALAMANFTIAFNAAKEKDLTRGAILNSYSEGLISRTDTKALLQEQDYSSDLADFYITKEDYDRDKKLLTLQIDNIKDRFLLSMIPESTANEQLNGLGLRGEKISLLLESWKLDKFKYQAIPSKTELDNFLIKGIITEGQYRDLMARHGFSSPHTSWYLEDIKRQREVSRRLPTKAELGKWYKAKFLSETEYRAEMKAMGYSDHYVELYFKSL